MKRLLIIISLLAPCIAFSVAAPSSVAAEDAPSERRVTLQIVGMVTENCPVLVKAAVGKLKGVKRVEASLKTKSAIIDYDPRVISAARIQKVIKDQVGFDSRVKS